MPAWGTARLINRDYGMIGRSASGFPARGVCDFGRQRNDSKTQFLHAAA
jgi:hypothetical protein